MLTKDKKINFIILLIPLPLIGLLFFIFSFEAKLPENLTIDSYQIENNTFGSEDIASYPTKGVRNWEEFLQDNISYPGEAVAAKFDGQVNVRFTVNTKGLLENLRFDEGLGYEFENQVIDALRKGLKWNPGRKNGQLAKTEIILPIQLRKS